MADQKSRGGQKEGHQHEHQGKEHRQSHLPEQAPSDRTMKEDAARGQQSKQGGYHGQHGSNR